MHKALGSSLSIRQNSNKIAVEFHRCKVSLGRGGPRYKGEGCCGNEVGGRVTESQKIAVVQVL